MDEALREFRPRRRTAIEGVALTEALGRVPPGPLTAPPQLPDFVRADAGVAAGDVLAPAGRPLRAADIGLLAAVGLTVVPVRARPRVAIVSAGARRLTPGQARDAISPAICALAAEAGGHAEERDILRDDAASLRAALEDALSGSDLVVVSPGSSVAARELAAVVVGSLGEPGVWCRGLAVEPGGPTLLAECAGVPVFLLPGGPLARLVIFRLIGIPLVRLLGGCSIARTPVWAPAVLSRDLPSVEGRLDVVQVKLRDGRAEPLLTEPAPLSTIAAADGCVLVPTETSNLSAGARVDVELYR